MMASRNSVSFRLKKKEEGSVEHGRALATKYHLAGRVRLVGTMLHLEWGGTREVAEAGRGVARQVIEPVPPASVSVPAAGIASIELIGRWLHPRIEISTSELGSLELVPSAHAGHLRLWIARRDRAMASELVMSVQLAMADLALEAAESMARLPGDSGGER